MSAVLDFGNYYIEFSMRNIYSCETNIRKEHIVWPVSYCIQNCIILLAAILKFMQMTLVFNFDIYLLTYLACNNPYVH